MKNKNQTALNNILNRIDNIQESLPTNEFAINELEEIKKEISSLCEDKY